MQTGRVARISRGRYKGKLVAIVDVIDQNRVSMKFSDLSEIDSVHDEPT